MLKNILAGPVNSVRDPHKKRSRQWKHANALSKFTLSFENIDHNWDSDSVNIIKKYPYNKDNSRKIIEISYSLLSFNISPCPWSDIIYIFFFKRKEYWATSRLGSNEILTTSSLQKRTTTTTSSRQWVSQWDIII